MYDSRFKSIATVFLVLTMGIIERQLRFANLVGAIKRWAALNSTEETKRQAEGERGGYKRTETNEAGGVEM